MGTKPEEVDRSQIFRSYYCRHLVFSLPSFEKLKREISRLTLCDLI